MLIKDQNKLPDDIVKISPIILQGFPLVSLTLEHLVISQGFKFSSLSYQRPSNASRKGSARIELLNNSGDILIKELEFEFSFSEDARLQDARRQESFKIRPETLLKRDPKNINKFDIVPKYEDVMVTDVVFSSRPFVMTKRGYKKSGGESSDSEFGYLLIDYYFSSNSNLKDREEQIQIPIQTTGDENVLEEISSSKALKINILKVTDYEVEAGLAKTIDDITRFQVRPQFLNGAPPVKVDLSILIPGVGVKFRKVDYIPPKTVKDKLAYLQVEYFYNERIYNERVKFLFAKSIQESVEALIRTIPLSDFQYLPKNRVVPPSFMRFTDFRYAGDIHGIEIPDIIYNYEAIDDDERFVTLELIISYRMVDVAVRKKLEFRYSKNEYVEGKWRLARTENGSVELHPKFHDPIVIHDVYNGDKTLQKEMVKTAKIVSGYPYDYIKDIQVVNFEDDSHYAMFKITAIEVHGKAESERPFEKWIELKDSYFEGLLAKLTDKDITINKKLLPQHPPSAISERYFTIDDTFKILSIQYEAPEDDDKNVSVELKVGTGQKTIFIKKEMVFEMSKNEFVKQQWNYDIQNYLHKIDPSSLSINVDVSGEPVADITKDMISGIPAEVQYEVSYKPPKVGSKHTRVLISLRKGEIKIAFEQTIIFGSPRTRKGLKSNIEIEQ